MVVLLAATSTHGQELCFICSLSRVAFRRQSSRGFLSKFYELQEAVILCRPVFFVGGVARGSSGALTCPKTIRLLVALKSALGRYRTTEPSPADLLKRISAGSRNDQPQLSRQSPHGGVKLNLNVSQGLQE